MTFQMQESCLKLIKLIYSEISGQMELVPTGIHNIYNHNGGRTINHWAYREGGR